MPRKPKNEAAEVETDAGSPAKLTVKASGKAPTNNDELVVHAAKAIALASGEDFVRRGQITLFLTTIARRAETTAEARAMIDDAYDAGLLGAYTAPAKAA